MRIKQTILSCCFLFCIACTQSEHDGQKNRAQEKRTDTVLENRQQMPDTNLLIPINKVTKSENIITLCITHELSLLDEKYVDKILYLEEGCFKFISIADYNKEKNTLKLCKHYVGDNNHV